MKTAVFLMALIGLPNAIAAAAPDIDVGIKPAIVIEAPVAEHYTGRAHCHATLMSGRAGATFACTGYTTSTKWRGKVACYADSTLRSSQFTAETASVWGSRTVQGWCPSWRPFAYAAWVVVYS